VKKLFLFIAITSMMLIFAAPLFARDPALDVLLKAGKVTEEELAAAEAEAKCSAMKSQSCDLMIGGYARALYTWKDDATNFDDTFSINSVYMWARGMVAKDWYIFLSWYVHDPMLIDAKLTYEYDKFLKISAGQFLLPYSWEQLTSTSKIDTILRAGVSNTLASHRDIGVMAEGALMEDKFGYGLALVNGNGINTTDNNDKKDIVARIWAQPFLGTEGSPLAGLMVAAATQFGDEPNIMTTTDPITGVITETDLGDQTRTRWIGTAAWTFKQIKIQGEYLYQELEDTNVKSDGYYVVATYDIPVNQVGMILQPLAKYEQLDANDDVDDDETNIATLGANFFFADRKARIALNYRLIDETPEIDNNEVLGMFQLIF